MTKTKLNEVISGALVLDREIAEDEKKLKIKKVFLDAMEGRIIAEAKARKGEQIKTDGGGKSWTYTTPKGATVRVIFPAPGLRKNIDLVEYAKLMRLCVTWCQYSGSFWKLFSEEIKYKLIPGFKEKSRELLGSTVAKKLFRLLAADTSAQVSYETKEAA